MPKVVDDFQQRLISFHGGKPLAPKIALAEMEQLGYRLDERSRQRAAQKVEAARQFKNIQAPFYEMIANDPRVAKGLEDFKKTNARLGKRRITPPPARPGISPRITSGSILSVTSTPYDYQWTWGTVGGSGFAGENAQKSNGTTLVFGTGNGNGNASASAGIGKYFRPISENVYVRFSAFVEYNYYWYDRSTYLTAHNDAFIGVLLISYDLNGGDPRTEMDKRTPLWSDGTSWFQDHRDEQQGIVWAQDDTVYFPATSNRQYIAWIWSNVSCDDDSNFLGSSYAVANLGLRVGFVVFEQYT